MTWCNKIKIHYLFNDVSVSLLFILILFHVLYFISIVESTLELDDEGVSVLMGPNSPRFEFIYLVGTDYNGWIDSKFTFVYKSILVIIQGRIKVSE